MNKIGVAILFLVSLCVVGVGSFYVGRSYLIYVINQNPNTASEDVLNEAKLNIDPLVLPDAPKGRTRLVQTPILRTVCTRMPALRILNLDPMPQETCRDVEDFTVTSVLDDATDQEKADYAAKVAALKADYDKKLAAEIQRVAELKRIKAVSEMVNAWKALIMDSIVPLISALAGLIGAIVAFKKAFSTKPS